MKTHTCTCLDCPDTHPEIICQLCDWWYPYGGAVCRNMFNRWLKEEKEVQDLHKQYQEQCQERNSNVIKIHFGRD